jgi:hypothetical protein
VVTRFVSVCEKIIHFALSLKVFVAHNCSSGLRQQPANISKKQNKKRKVQTRPTLDGHKSIRKMKANERSVLLSLRNCRLVLHGVLESLE